MIGVSLPEAATVLRAGAAPREVSLLGIHGAVPVPVEVARASLLMAPRVAAALADWLDSVQDAVNPEPGRTIACVDEQHAFAVARAILGPRP